MKRHLIVKPSAIGDVILTIPAVDALKRQLGGEVWWVCGEMAAPILDRYSFIDKVIRVNEQKLFRGHFIDRVSQVSLLWRSLAGIKFETYAVLQYDRRYRVLGLPVRSARTISLKRGDRAREAIRGRSVTDEFARLLLGRDGPIEAPLPPIPMPGLGPKQKSKKRRIGIVPGGARNLINDSPLRRWPLAHYVALTKILTNSGCEVVLLGAGSDRWTLPSFEDCVVSDELGSLSLVESIELIARLDVVVTHDTGLLHMAALTETPIVALFGPTNPREVLPNRANIACLWGGERLACRPCYDGLYLPKQCREHFCLESVTPECVFDAVRGITTTGHSLNQLSGGIQLTAIRSDTSGVTQIRPYAVT